jgi:hypothetical protein
MLFKNCAVKRLQKQSQWETDAELLNSIKVVHFTHDLEFTNVLMSTRWRDYAGNIEQEDSRLLTV